MRVREDFHYYENIFKLNIKMRHCSMRVVPHFCYVVLKKYNKRSVVLAVLIIICTFAMSK